jgi:ABC-type phosphate/phosphonate transport system substrate-binding protein
MSGFSVVAMYGYAELRDAWDQLYASAAQHVDGAPAALSWDRDIYESWTDAGLALGQSCGWPLVTRLANQVAVVGTFTHVVCELGDPVMYRSVLIARESRPLEAFATTTAAVNGIDSLSGWISLSAAISFAGPIVVTGSHRASIASVACGQADVASIDAVTWWHAQRLWPTETAGLVVVGQAPVIPGLPLIVALPTTAELIAQWRVGLAAACTQNPRACAQLGITGFVPLDLAGYQRALSGLS